jgi:hypothetical protein
MATAQIDFLGQKRAEMDARMAELKPLVDEYQRLEQAVAALDNIVPHAGNGTASTKQATTRVKAATSKSRATPKASTGTRGRPKGSGKRGEQAIEIVTANPGIEIPQIAEHLGIKQNYLYRVLPELAKDGKVRKEGRGWFPVIADVQ